MGSHPLDQPRPDDTAPGLHRKRLSRPVLSGASRHGAGPMRSTSPRGAVARSAVGTGPVHGMRHRAVERPRAGVEAGRWPVSGRRPTNDSRAVGSALTRSAVPFGAKPRRRYNAIAGASAGSASTAAARAPAFSICASAAPSRRAPSPRPRNPQVVQHRDAAVVVDRVPPVREGVADIPALVREQPRASERGIRAEVMNCRGLLGTDFVSALAVEAADGRDRTPGLVPPRCDDAETVLLGPSGGQCRLQLWANHPGVGPLRSVTGALEGADPAASRSGVAPRRQTARS